MDEDKNKWMEDMKMALNNAIWMHAPKNITLGQAEEAASSAFHIICDHHLEGSDEG